MSKSKKRFQTALSTAGMKREITDLPGSTRTAEEAAASVGCDVAQIAKSIVFRGTTSGSAVLVIMSGINRVDTEKVAAHIGEPIGRADAEFVRAQTGFAIGGVPPFGHVKTVTTLLDEDLMAFERVWAAAGGPFSVFETTPGELARVTGAPILNVKT